MWKKLIAQANNQTLLIIVGGIVIIVAILAYTVPDILDEIVEALLGITP